MEHQPGLYEKYIKRCVDFVLAFLAVILLSPVLAAVAILVRYKLGSPVLYKQQRPGLHERVFTIYKFRTMTDERDVNGELMPDEIRLTKFGKILRSTSLDELPELFNILKGDMAIVGPRPLLVQYLPLYNQRQKLRHAVRPGITGYAQVNGRNSISWAEKFELDVKYVETISAWIDMKIFLKTIKSVAAREGINSDTSVTMEAFTGNEAGTGTE